MSPKKAIVDNKKNELKSSSIQKLKQINLNTISPSEITKKFTLFQEFMEFMKKYGVLGLALGIVIGGAIKSLVDSFTIDIINPILGKIMGKVDLNSLVVWDIQIGKFLTQLINFTILLFIVYVFIRLFLTKFMTEEEKEKLKVI